MYLVECGLLFSNYSHDFSWRCGFHGYALRGGNNSLQLGATTQHPGKNFSTLLHKMPWCTPVVTSPPHVLPIMHWGPPGSLRCVCVCLLQPLERPCVSLEASLTCFIMCFYANPPVGHPMGGRQHGKEEGSKNTSALMRTLTVCLRVVCVLH